MPDAAFFHPVDVPTPSGRQTMRRWQGECAICHWKTEVATGQESAAAIMQHNRREHLTPLPGEKRGAMPPAK